MDPRFRGGDEHVILSREGGPPAHGYFVPGAGFEFLPAVSASLRCDAATSRRYRDTLR